MIFAQVIVDISVEELDKTFQYIIPSGLEDVITVGSRVTIPFGRTTRTGYVVGIGDEPEIEFDRLKELVGIAEKSLSVDSKFIKLAYWMKNKYGSTMNQALKTVLPVKKSIQRTVKKTVHLLISKKEAISIYEEFMSKHQIARARVMAVLIDEPELDSAVLLDKSKTTMATVKSLSERGILDIYETEIFRNRLKTDNDFRNVKALNKEQQEVADAIITEWDCGNNTPCLIRGVTGSGKTEVYMELIEHVTNMGKEAIVLIPEIALTYQTVMRFYNRFGDKISIIHSRLSEGERFDRFELARQGKIKIMIGPRTALFTPFSNLGLIIIDEEHENAYKSDITPKYHAREVAMELASLNEAKVVLGSATPSMESYYNATNGVYNLYRLTKRAGNGTLPKISVVDLRDELKQGNRSVFSNRLFELMEDRLQKKEQIMLFLNRRGYQGFINCRDCGKVVECPHCAVSLTQHNNNKLMCHYCGYETVNISKCPSCGSPHVGAFKAGTQKIEEAVKKSFPDARVLRMDMDTTKGKDGHGQILKQFMDGEADILIGTQMIVKGHDFPNVTLVGILLADTSLHTSDFTAAENTFQLLVQASGRAGRGEIPGEVVIQTYDPEHYAIEYAANNDYDSFYEEEIGFRELMNYPPVTGMMSATIASADEAKAVEVSEYIKNKTQIFDTVVIGPANAPIYKMKDVFYRKIYYKNPNNKDLARIRELIFDDMDANSEFYKGCQIQFDLR